MRSRFDLLLPFILIGIGLWALSGVIVAMGSFEPVRAVVGSFPPELAKQAADHWSNAMLYTALTWGGLGGIFGLINGLMYFLRPSHEHFTAIPRSGPGGPKTVAELNSGFQAWLLGFTMVIIAAIIILPGFQTQLLTTAPVNTRVGFACVCGIMCIIPVLPFSLKYLENKY